MFLHRLTLCALAMSSTSCTDQNIQKSRSGEKVVSEETALLAEKLGQNTGVSPDSAAEVPREAALSLAPSPVDGSVFCDRDSTVCGPGVLIHLPLQGIFQEGSGGPTEPIELKGIFEFYQTSECLRAFLAKGRDLRHTYGSGCTEVDLGIAAVADGGTLAVNQGEYYVRVRGHDGAPYTHLIWSYVNSDRSNHLLSIEPLDVSAGVEDPLLPMDSAPVQ